MFKKKKQLCSICIDQSNTFSFLRTIPKENVLL